MSNRAWFYASQDNQQISCSEEELRRLIAAGNVTADTLVWSEGMTDWQRAGEIPDLQPSLSRPPAMPPSRGALPAIGSGTAGSQLAIDLDIWEFTWRTIVFVICSIFVIPFPWAFVWYLKWLVPRVRVPGRPNLSFEGTAMTIVPWYFGLVVLSIVLAFLQSATDTSGLNNLAAIAQVVLYWLFLKWLIANIASSGRLLGLTFAGSFWAYLGWTVLGALSTITIVGWAWIGTAATRWFCRNIEGTRRAVVFKGSGFELLWRGIVAAIASLFIIPIPWVYRWMTAWFASQTELVETGSMTNPRL
jgi:hypothetical protein